VSAEPTRTYALHGLRLEVSGWEPATAAVDARLRRLATGTAESGPLRFEFRQAATAPFAPPRHGRPVYNPPSGRVLFADEEDVLYIEVGETLAALCRPDEGRAEIAVVAASGSLEPADLYLLSHPLFTLPLCELTKRRGLFSLHAAGLCRDGRALLLPGQSGAGKSTLAVALARAGFGLLGDDTVFLARRPGGLRVLAFPDEVDLTEESAALLAGTPDRRTRPHLASPFPNPLPPRGRNPLPRPAANMGQRDGFPSLLDAARRRRGLPSQDGRGTGARKLALAPERLAAGGLVAECAPGWLVFPRIAGGAASELVPMPRDEALLALAPEVLPTERRSSQAHLDALAELVAASEPWCLATGRDLAGAVALLAELTGR
jgi:hypothetical protein